MEARRCLEIATFANLLLLFVLFSFLVHNDNHFSTINETFSGNQVFHLGENVGGLVYGEPLENLPLQSQHDGLERLKDFYYDFLLLAEFSVASVKC